MSNQQTQQRQQLSAKASFENNPNRTSTGIGHVQLPDGYSFLKFKSDNAVRIDILPFRVKNPKIYGNLAVNNLWYERTFHQHRNIGEHNRSVICPKMTWGDRCPICEYRAKFKWDDEEDRKLIKALRPQERQLFNVVVLSDPQNYDPDQVYILDQSQFSFLGLLRDIVLKADEDEAHYQYFADLYDGMTIKINLEEAAFENKTFFNIKQIAFKTRQRKYDESWLDKTIDPESCLVKLSYDEISEILYSSSNSQQEPEVVRSKVKQEPVQTAKKQIKLDDDDDDDDEIIVKKKEVPVKKTTFNATKRNSVVDQWNDDDDDEVDTSNIPF
jgi:hypothetical protein